MKAQLENVPLQMRFDPNNIVGQDADESSYLRVPVDSFGLDMLSRMGWSEVRGIGKNSKNQLKKPIEFIPRQQGQGLGASVTPAFLQPGYNKNKDVKTEMVSASGKSYNYIGEKLVEKNSKPQINDEVQIIGGKHKGIFGIVTAVKETEVVIELKNEQQVNVAITSVKIFNQLKKDENKKQISKSRSRSRSREEEKQEKSLKKLKWVQPDIRIQVTSKKVNNGKLYEVKGTISDVLDKYKFVMVTESGEIVENLREKYIQTIVPKVGGRVKILKGENKGKIGIVEERDKKKEKVIVQINDESDFWTGDWDDVSEYVGA